MSPEVINISLGGEAIGRLPPALTRKGKIQWL